MLTKYKLSFDLDDPRMTLAHREIISRKPYLRRLYADWYGQMIRELSSIPGGAVLEIGSGGGFLKEMLPQVITSDILELPNVDRVFSAEEMPFERSSLAGILMLNVFHHIPRPYRFLREAERTLLPGGRVIMIEPANSMLARFIYKKFHHEPFDEQGPREISPGNPLSHSNQALPYIYFERDVAWFRQEFPELRIHRVNYHTPVSYIFSGGVSRPALLPAPLFQPVRFLEYLTTPLSRQIGLFCTIVLERR
jgi:SAM-dependent methyltransferase